jgi:NTP pyrophosphatase (non-canonical NTP hydrolase)
VIGLKSPARFVLLTQYMDQVEPTDKLALDDLQPILLGLFGEVGSIMATAKKFHREGEAYAGYRHAVEEEFGDALWYFTALCRMLTIRVDELLAGAASEETHATSIATPLTVPGLDAALLQLGEAAAGLFVLRASPGLAHAKLAAFADSYLGGGTQKHRQDQRTVSCPGLCEPSNV